MAGNPIVPKNPAAVPALLASMGISPVTTRDEITVSYRDGLIEAQVKRPSGQTITATKSVRGNFNSMSSFEPDSMSLENRNALIRRLYKGGRGATQHELAKKFGISQAMVSKIVRED
jgi:DNA-directed RNA polymerase specialized sigma subunit